ncbi:hypothetical protein HPP92_019144 [Vanilla planifolia]|uniref:Protein MIZU-KUSSEI 1 n=1 Tax=Vanilla planifolia TaxID=51239 RepID=A0A835Q6W9_VANPL|nr:hypothetical protein HPP92_019662 [Vanilla planifolia]KAG0464980.1 hypothetical protein HPP92_019144 [Vanilla planifolia]
MRTTELRNQRGLPPLPVIDAATDVDCGKDVRLSRRSLRYLVDCMVPFCCGLHPSPDVADDISSTNSTTTSSSSSSVVTGTFFGHRRGRVSFCLQDEPRGPPLLVLELAVPTAFLAREMQHGVLRIALEHNVADGRCPRGGLPLFAVPAWTMFCNGRRVGYAVRRVASGGDVGFLRAMRAVSVGAGYMPSMDEKLDGCGHVGGGGDVLYMRARFERVIGSVDSESFHMINPKGSTSQELSVFFLRS